MRKFIYLALAIGFLVAAFPLARAVFPAVTRTQGITFNPDQQLVNPSRPSVFGVQSLEPGIKTDQAGNIYMNAIRGVPAGTDIWKTTTTGCQDAVDARCPIFYEGQPEGLVTTGSGAGGGDIDMDIGQPYKAGDCNDPGPAPSNGTVCSGSTTGNLYMASLTLADQTVITCKDANLALSSCTTRNPKGTSQTDEDREWVASEGKHTAYLSYHVVGPQSISVCKSTNDGAQYTACSKADTETAAMSTYRNRIGNILADQSGTTHYLYQIYSSVQNPTQVADLCPLNTVYMGVSDDSAGPGTLGVVWHDYPVFSEPVTDGGSPGTCTGTRTDVLFPVVAVDQVGNVFAEWSTGKDVFFSSSTDHGQTWNGKKDGTGPPSQVDQHFGTPDCKNTSGQVCGLQTALFPWMAATGNGHVDFVWYGSPTTVQPGANPDYGDTTSPWAVFFAETFNGTNASPNVFQTQANHELNHIGPICISGTTCMGGRTLGDFFQVAIEPTTGCAVIAYANDRAVDSKNVALPTVAYFNRQFDACTSPPSAPTAAPLSRVHGHTSSTGAHFSWHASTVNTLGFNIYGAATARGALHRLNARLILAKNLKADLTAAFLYRAPGAHLRWFYLERIQDNGKAVRYGPYRVGHSYL